MNHCDLNACLIDSAAAAFQSIVGKGVIFGLEAESLEEGLAAIRLGRMAVPPEAALSALASNIMQATNIVYSGSRPGSPEMEIQPLYLFVCLVEIPVAGNNARPAIEPFEQFRTDINRPAMDREIFD